MILCVLVSQEKKCSFSLKFKLLKVYRFEESLHPHDGHNKSICVCFLSNSDCNFI